MAVSASKVSVTMYTLYVPSLGTELAQKPIQTLYGHDNEVTAVHISIELDMAVSASKVSVTMYTLCVPSLGTELVRKTTDMTMRLRQFTYQ